MAKYRAQYAYNGELAEDLSFKKNDIIWVYDQPANGWWFGRTEDGRQGLFPYNRVQEVVDDGEDFDLNDFMTSPNKKSPVAAKQDDIANATVTVKLPVLSYGQQFEVKVTLGSNNVLIGAKKMKDFRILNEALNKFNNTESDIIGLDRSERVNSTIPLWADNISLDEQYREGKMEDRASILNDWLQHNIKRNTGSDYLISYWLDGKTGFVASEGEKKDASSFLNQAASAIERKGFDAPKLAVTLYTWNKREDNDITLEKGEIIALSHESEYNGWYVGEKVNGHTGLFPFNYVKELSPEEADAALYPEKQPKKKAPKVKEQPKPNFTQNAFMNPGFGVGTANDTNVYQPVSQKPAFSPPQATSAPKNRPPRNRQKLTHYQLSCIEAFDELIDNGVTVEENGTLAEFNAMRDTPQNGDTVTLYYNGYIWEPQKQELLEFSSSDKLVGNTTAEQAGPLVFELGANLAIDGIEEVAKKMSLGQKVRVTISPEKAYGDPGLPPQIPGNAYLVYDLELRDISRSGQSAARNNGVQRSAVVNRGPSSRNLPQNNFNAGSSNVDVDKYKGKLSLVQLQKIVQHRNFHEYGINPKIIEEYLTEEDFIRTFKFDRNNWNFISAYRRNEMLQHAGLYVR